MSQEMNRSQLIEVVKFSILNSNPTTKIPLAIWGIHGVGKTEMIKQIAEEIGYNVVPLHLAMQDICDLIGIPAKREIKNSDGSIIDTVQDWSCPAWLHDAVKNFEATGKPNLFFLDEFNRGNRIVLAAMLPFLIEGVLHTHRIGPKDAVIAACNPANDKYEVSEIIDEALLNRLGHICLRPTHDEYVSYLRSKGVDKTTIKVVANSPGYTKIPEFDLGFEVKPSRRSIFNVMSIVGKQPSAWIKKNGKHVIEAYLGTAFSDEWLSEYSNRDESISLDMLKDFDNNNKEIIAAITTEIEKEKTHRLDILSKTIEIIKTYINDRKDKIDVNDIKWMIKFFSIPIIPDDASAAVFMANKILKRKIMNDVEINILVTNFLKNKKIVGDAYLNSWACDADKASV